MILKRILRKVRWIFRKRIKVPEIDEKRNVIEHYRNLYNTKVFIESGTFFGDTVNTFKDKFDYIYSIELSETLASKARIRFQSFRNIEIIHGDSGIVLSAIIPKLKVPALFWLDGHYSSEFFVNDELIKTAKGESNTPIEKELGILKESTVKHIILIDDARLFNGKDGYPTIKEIKKKINPKGSTYNVFVRKDIIHLIPQ